MSDVAKETPTASSRSRWFWTNLGGLCLLAPFATFWFQQHLQLYFTEIVVVGGAFTLWALVRLIWGLIERFTKFDAWESSRSFLSSPAMTRILLVGAIVFILLWFSTSSIYLELRDSDSTGEYRVEVLRKADGSPLLENATLSAARAALGAPHFWHWETTQLQCRIVQPIEYEPRDCSLSPGTSTRIRVPGDFKRKEFHLLRIVPVGSLYRTLPQDTDQPVTRYQLEIKRGNEVTSLADIRKQTIYFGARDDEMPLVMRLEEPDKYEHFLDTRFRVDGQDKDSASLSAAVLSSSTRVWPAMYVKSGDKLIIKVLWTKSEEGRTESGTLDEFPINYQVTADPVQTLWLPNRS